MGFKCSRVHAFQTAQAEYFTYHNNNNNNNTLFKLLKFPSAMLLVLTGEQ
jgi:hypothetical protein